jgi:hypothetical protein
LIIVVFGLWSAHGYGQSNQVGPSEVYAEVRVLEDVVESIRFHMGVPAIAPLKLDIENAQPHDVFFQALALYQKTSQLLFQVARIRPVNPEVPQGVYRPVDVLRYVQSAYSNVAAVQLELGIASTSGQPQVEVGMYEKEPTDVFLAILALNRRLNSLLDTPFSPSEVFMEVTRAIGYASLLLAAYPEVQRIPAVDEVTPGRLPGDVFFRQLDLLTRIKQLYQLKGLSSIEVTSDRVERKNITPGDVFQLASLVVARLDFLHKYHQISMPPRNPYYPGKVYPTDVYRQSGILLKQLDSLIGLYQQDQNTS